MSCCPAAEVYDQHLLTTLQARTLQSVTDAALDEAGEGLMDWKLLEPNCRLRGLARLMQALKVCQQVVLLHALGSVFGLAVVVVHKLVVLYNTVILSYHYWGAWYPCKP